MKSSPVKLPTVSWEVALNEFKPTMSAEHVRITLNMQLLYQTRDAKFDFAAKRGKRMAALLSSARNSGVNMDDEADNDFDPVWENVMQAAVEPDDLVLSDVQHCKQDTAEREEPSDQKSIGGSKEK
ncbi:hypothetical protein B0H12DRAFT_1077984 [Mycena haematopus]|nr:hypothetical protein B0H12DRAFT_1077984 [Mycena haematopus]